MFVNWADWWRPRRCPHQTTASRTWFADDAVHTETLCVECGERLSPERIVSDETVMKMLIEHTKQV